MSPNFPLLVFFLYCLCLLTEENIAHGQKVTKYKSRTTEQAKNSKTYKVRHKNKRWKIKTTNGESVEFGEDYQEGWVCSKKWKDFGKISIEGGGANLIP